MCALKKDLRDEIEEKNDREIEAFLEKSMENILSRGFLLTNVIFVLLGVYGLILSPLLFPTTDTKVISNSTFPVNTANNIFTFTFNPNISDPAFLALLFSLILITVAFVFQMRSIKTADGDLTQKFIIKNDTIQLKHGNFLKSRNEELSKDLTDQIRNNDKSSFLIGASLITFFIFMLLAKLNKYSMIAVYMFGIGVVVLIALLFNPPKKRNKTQPLTKTAQCKKVTLIQNEKPK